jgi:enoyl-CoA hydratase
VDRVANAIANSGPIAVRDQKQLVRDWEKLSLEDGIKAGIQSFSNAFKTDEPNRMMQPFLNRKKLSPN